MGDTIVYTSALHFVTTDWDKTDADLPCFHDNSSPLKQNQYYLTDTDAIGSNRRPLSHKLYIVYVHCFSSA